ncbi:MAG: threonine aldolase family protein [Chloroflexota bacterium]
MKPSIKIDLYSDTVTRPTPGMRQAISQAEVGNEQKQEDPTVNRLVELSCELLGQEDAIFLPSGTMCNEIAYRVHCQPGDEIIIDETGHPRHFETGGPAALSGAMIYPLTGTRGIFSPEQVEAAVRSASHHFPRSRVLSVEQTSNMGGGTVWPLSTMQAVCEVADTHGLSKHLDGARLMNAVVASGISASDYAASFDSVWLDFTKGLGAPVGAVLAGSKAFIQEAWRWKHQFGGAMRQSGIIAAGAIYALENNIERLAEDHANSRRLADGLSQIEGITVEPVETNLIFFDVEGLGLTAAAFDQQLHEQGIRMSPMGPTRVRAVTHLDVSSEQIEETLQVVAGFGR